MAISLVTEADMAQTAAELLGGSSSASCAVAFWGEGAACRLGLTRPNQARVICNLESGCCKPSEIRRLQAALTKPSVRTHPKLHAKVFVSTQCVLVGSSNASTNGMALYPEDLSGWREANLRTDDPDVIRNMTNWFEERWKESTPITDRALERAQILWDRRSAFTAQSTSSQELIAATTSNRSAFEKENIVVFAYTELQDPGIEQEIDEAVARGEIFSDQERTKYGSSYWFYDGWETFPEGAWIIDLYVPTEGKSKVYGIAQTSTPVHRTKLENGTTAFIAFPKRAISLPGGTFPIGRAGKSLIERHGPALLDIAIELSGNEYGGPVPLTRALDVFREGGEK